MRHVSGRAPSSLAARSKQARRLAAATILASGGVVALHQPAGAIPIEVNIPGLTVNWNSTITFNSLFQTETVDKLHLADPNDDDTERNIRNGLAAQRFDLLSEVDVKYGNFGARGSAVAWDDLLYNFGNDNNSPSTLNTFVANHRDYSLHTQQLAGYHAEVADLFTYGAFPLSDTSRLTYRIGQFVQIWGESLFLATNGISAGQNPIDGIKGQILLNPQARDIYLPTPQVSATYEVNSNLSFSAYYKLGWRQTRIDPAGTYFSPTNILDVGGDKLFIPGLGGLYLSRISDIRPNGLDGQGGIDMRYRFGDYDLGLYAIRYDDTTPGQVLYIHPGFTTAPYPALGGYQLVYARGIQAYGASFSTDVFDVINVAGEVSARRNQPLVSLGEAVPLYAGNSNNVFYPMGDTLHGQVSFIYASKPIHLIRSNQLQLLGEIGGNHLLEFTQNRENFSPYANHTALLGTVVLSLSYLEALPKTGSHAERRHLVRFLSHLRRRSGRRRAYRQHQRGADRALQPDLHDPVRVQALLRQQQRHQRRPRQPLSRPGLCGRGTAAQLLSFRPAPGRRHRRPGCAFSSSCARRGRCRGR